MKYLVVILLILASFAFIDATAPTPPVVPAQEEKVVEPTGVTTPQVPALDSPGGTNFGVKNPKHLKYSQAVAEAIYTNSILGVAKHLRPMSPQTIIAHPFLILNLGAPKEIHTVIIKTDTGYILQSTVSMPTWDENWWANCVTLAAIEATISLNDLIEIATQAKMDAHYTVDVKQLVEEQRAK